MKKKQMLEIDMDKEKDISSDLINQAFKKLQSALYFEKQNLHLICCVIVQRNFCVHIMEY